MCTVHTNGRHAFMGGAGIIAIARTIIIRTDHMPGDRLIIHGDFLLPQSPQPLSLLLLKATTIIMTRAFIMSNRTEATR